jgi:hypothetical protein
LLRSTQNVVIVLREHSDFLSLIRSISFFPEVTLQHQQFNIFILL